MLALLAVSAAMAMLANPVAAQLPPPTTTTTAVPTGSAPTVYSLSPSSGPAAGNVEVYLAGTGFSGATAVLFGDQPAIAYTVLDDTQIKAIAPPPATVPAPEVVVDVTVQTAAGTSATTPSDLFQYWAPPVITATAPDPFISSTEGNQILHLTVSNAGDPYAFVQIDGVYAEWGSEDGHPERINATTGPHAAGPVDVVVGGSGGVSAPVTLTYVDTPLPDVLTLSPDHATLDGGTTVIVTGTHLTGAKEVSFGGLYPAASYTVDSDTQITLVTPAVPRFGNQQLSIVTPVGQSRWWEPTAAFRFDGPPVASSISPVHGPTAGGSHVVIYGEELDRVTGVSFGGVPAPSWTGGDSQIITAVTPPHAAGSVTVTLDSALGPNREAVAYEYTDNGGPLVESLTPTTGPITGGTSVIVTGSGFTGATRVVLGYDGWNATDAAFSVVSDTQLTLVTPPWPYGDRMPVVITTPLGSNEATEGAMFTYEPAPVVYSVTPNFGPPAGGTPIVLYGSTLDNATSVRIDGASVPFTWNAGFGVLEVVTPPHVAGRVVIVVENESGPSDATPMATNTFVYADPGVPVVEQFWPTTGPDVGGTEVTISGSNLDNVTGVRFGSTPATSFHVTSENGAVVVKAIAPPHALGTVEITLQSTAGDSLPPVAWHYEYVAQTPPAITFTNPTNGPVGGGSPVDIYGNGFLGATSVTYGGIAATFTVVDDNHITAVTPPAADQTTGSTVPVVVTTPLGASSAAGEMLYTYRIAAAPTVSSLSPNRGPIGGGQDVLIAGTDFTGATSVRFGTHEATFTVTNDQTILATTPAVADPYVYDVTITTPHGANPSSPSSWYLYRSQPVVWGIEANTGSVLGGNTVTITGDQFLDAWSVSFGWNNAVGFRVVDQHTIIATVPACSAGTVWVIVGSPEGTSAVTLGSLYTFRAQGAPVVTKTEANRGSTAGGETVVLTGSGFTGATAVRFENAPATSFTVESDTRITAVAPARAGAGLVNIDIDTPGGTNPNAPASWYLYESP